jgi:hypothetical protein
MKKLKVKLQGSIMTPGPIHKLKVKLQGSIMTPGPIHKLKTIQTTMNSD